MSTWPGSLPGQGTALVSTSLTEPMLTTFPLRVARSSFQDGGDRCFMALLCDGGHPATDPTKLSPFSLQLHGNQHV